VYDPDTGQLLTGSFMDYPMPRAGLVNGLAIREHPVPTATNPLGAKGVGEAGVSGSLPALMNAVADALRQAGVTRFDMPATPDRVWRAIRAQSGRTLVKGIIMNHGDISPEIAQGLKVLQERIANAKIPSSKLDETLNIATWNIREFGKKERSEAAIHYIAEILGQFDLISIAELRDNLTDLGRVLEVLGPTWRVIYSDALRDSGGNNERVGFVYDKRAVAFSGFAATANPPREKVGNLYLPKFDWWREPFMASFSAGSFDFVFLAAHAQWGRRGASGGAAVSRRMDRSEAEREDLRGQGSHHSRGLQYRNARAARGFDRERASDARRPQGQVLRHEPGPEQALRSNSALPRLSGEFLEPGGRG